MKKIVLGRGATKRIVKRGTPIKRDGRQTLKKAERAKLLNPKVDVKNPEIFLATVAASWTQNGSRNAEISIAYYDRTAGATVTAVALSPLSRENDLLAEGTQILVVKTVDGAIYLLNAECPQ